MRTITCWMGLWLLACTVGTGYGRTVAGVCLLKDTTIRPARLTNTTAAEGSVARFYQLTSSGLSWCARGNKTVGLRGALLSAVDSAAFYGLERGNYLPDLLQWADSMVQAGQMPAQWRDWDRWYTEAALTLARDMYEGAGIEDRLSYDGVSERYAAGDEQYLAEGLARVSSGARFTEWLAGLVPDDAGYRLMRDSLALYLRIAKDSRRSLCAPALKRAERLKGQ